MLVLCFVMVVLELEEDVVANMTAIPSRSTLRQHEQRVRSFRFIPHPPRASRVKSHHTRLYENEPRSGSITSIIYHTCLHRSSTRPKRFTCSLLSSLTSLAE
jgi:hypothetical protein